MAVSYIGGAAHNETNPTTSYTVTIPATTQTDDILLLFAANDTPGVQPVPTDDDSGGNVWRILALASDAAINGSIWFKRATSASASKTVTHSGLTDACSGALAVYRGCGTGGMPFFRGIHEVNASADESHAGFTTVTNGCLVLIALFNAATAANPSTFACTDPGALDAHAIAGSAGGTTIRVDVFGKVQATAGATGTFTWAQTDGTSVSITLAIEPPMVAATGGAAQLVNTSGLVA